MEAKQPTEEEKQEFWEWCGFKEHYEDEGSRDTGTWYWLTPDKFCLEELPPIDLNNLFQYAMPKLDQAQYYECLKSIFLKTGNPTLALFWAIWEAIHGSQRYSNTSL